MQLLIYPSYLGYCFIRLGWSKIGLEVIDAASSSKREFYDYENDSSLFNGILIISVGITSISYVPITLQANTFDRLLAGNISRMILCLLLSFPIYAPNTGIFLLEINDRWGQRIYIYFFGFAPKETVERALLTGRVFEAFLSNTAERYKRFYILRGGGLILDGSLKFWTLTPPTRVGPT